MTRILDRYVAGQFLRLFLLFEISAPLLFVVLDATDHLDDLLEEGYTGTQVLLNYVYQFPLFMLWAFPLAALIGTVFTVNTMARHSEVAAAKAGGISFYRLVASVPVLAVVLTFAALGLSELVPIANQKRAETLGQRGNFRSSRSDFVYRAGDGRTYSIDRLDTDAGKIFGLTVEREGNEQIAGVHIVASEASFDSTGGWTLHNGYMRVLPPDSGAERAYRFSALVPTAFTETPEQLLARPRDPEEMRYEEMGRFIEILERSGARPLELMVEHAQKIAIPVATFIIVLFAAPLAITAHRGGAAWGIGVSLGITLLYMMLFKIAAAAGAAGTLSPMVAAWAPNALFLLAALVLMARIRS